MSTAALAGASGLTDQQAGEVLARMGRNVLPEPSRAAWWRRLVAQVVHFFALLLWAAAGLALVAGMPALAVAIGAVVLINAAFAFVQEGRAERAAAGLRDLLPDRATVVRSGREQQVTVDLIVPGDLVLLGAGDRVSADMRCASAEGLLVDVSTLTGESVPQPVEAGHEVFAGSFVLRGTASALVTATGAGTRLGSIARLSTQRRPPTPLERQVQRLVRTVAVVAGAVGVGFFLLMLVLGVPASDGFIFGIGVTVALVPEGLLPTVTLSLAIGAQRMADQRALVRRLESVETLGATTFICTDKTGTLTQNRMSVVSVWTPAGVAEVAGAGYQPQAEVRYCPSAAEPAVRRAVAAAVLASPDMDLAGPRPSGDPMEVAVWLLAQRLGIAVPGTAGSALDDVGPVIERLAFDVHRRMAGAVLPGWVVVKGAPESVLTACHDPGDEPVRAMQQLAGRGLRVLAVAEGPADPRGGTDGGLADLTLLGLLAYHDPPREGVGEAIDACRRAGVRLAMITGDHPSTARAIAEQIGLAVPGSPVLTADQLPEDPQLLAATVDRDGLVLARAAPEDKLRVTTALQARGHVVAMTGDGVNDAPALRMADIGVAMGGSGTQVAREAADLVLLDDHFATIVAAVRQGRETFLNLRRFLTYHLTDNVAELAPFLLWALSGGRFPLALGVTQILALDLGTDTLPAAALGAERAGSRVLDHPPVSGPLLDRGVAVRAFGVLGPTEAVIEIAVFALALWGLGWRVGGPLPAQDLAAASGGAFLAVVVMQVANAFACRSTHLPAWRLGWLGNRLLLAAVGTSLGFALACLLVDPLARVLQHAWPPTAVLPLIAASGPILLGVDAAWKSRARHRRARRPGR